MILDIFSPLIPRRSEDIFDQLVGRLPVLGSSVADHRAEVKRVAGLLVSQATVQAREIKWWFGDSEIHQEYCQHFSEVLKNSEF